MSNLEGFLLNANDITNLSVDELGLRILNNVLNESAWSHWNWRSWMARAEETHAPNQDAVHALGEAWHWLFRKGLVMPYAYQESSADVFRVTRLGRLVDESGLEWLRSTERLDLELVPELQITARPQFMRGDFETAAFTAMKEVEVAVRNKAQLPNSLVGVKLMQAAFGNDGPLRSEDMEGGEAQALVDIYKGAIGSFKNPSSHRRVTFEDPTEAVEIILLADLLLRMLRKIDRL